MIHSCEGFFFNFALELNTHTYIHIYIQTDKRTVAMAYPHCNKLSDGKMKTKAGHLNSTSVRKKTILLLEFSLGEIMFSFIKQ